MKLYLDVWRLLTPKLLQLVILWLHLCTTCVLIWILASFFHCMIVLVWMSWDVYLYFCTFLCLFLCHYLEYGPMRNSGFPVSTHTRKLLNILLKKEIIEEWHLSVGVIFKETSGSINNTLIRLTENDWSWAWSIYDVLTVECHWNCAPFHRLHSLTYWAQYFFCWVFSVY